MTFAKKFYSMLVALSHLLKPFFLLAVRLFWGYMFFQTGSGKLMDLAGVSEYFASLHIPFPTINAAIAGTVEMFGGLCLIFGFAARLMAIPLIFTMLVALFTAEREAVLNVFSNSSDLLKATPFTFLMAALIIFFFGPGCFSIDAILEKYFGKKKDTWL
jgi:putative oxidoreductase